MANTTKSFPTATRPFSIPTVSSGYVEENFFLANDSVVREGCAWGELDSDGQVAYRRLLPHEKIGRGFTAAEAVQRGQVGVASPKRPDLLEAFASDPDLLEASGLKAGSVEEDRRRPGYLAKAAEAARWILEASHGPLSRRLEGLNPFHYVANHKLVKNQLVVKGWDAHLLQPAPGGGMFLVTEWGGWAIAYPSHSAFAGEVARRTAKNAVVAILQEEATRRARTMRRPGRATQRRLQAALKALAA